MVTGYCYIFFCSTFLNPDTRRAMGQQAVALAKSVQYESAGEYTEIITIIIFKIWLINNYEVCNYIRLLLVTHMMYLLH